MAQNNEAPWDNYRQSTSGDGAGPWSNYAPSKDSAPTGRSVADMAKDAAAWAVKGAIAVPEAAVGLADLATGGRAGKFLENEGGAVGFRPKQAREIVNDWHSDATKRAQQEFQQAEGFGGKLKAAVQNPSNIVGAVAESLPSMLAGGAIGRGLTAATRLGQMGLKGATMAGAAGEGVVGAGSAAEQIRQESEDGLLTPGQTGAALATGAMTGAIGYGAGKVANRLGIGDAETMLAQGQAGLSKQIADQAARNATNPLAATAAKSIPRQMVEGAISEGLLEELPQSVSEQILQNLALGKPWAEDVDASAVMGLLSGAAMGSGASGYRALREPRAKAEGAPVADGETPQNDRPTTGPTPGSGSAIDQMREAFLKGLAVQQEPSLDEARLRAEGVTPTPILDSQRLEQEVGAAAPAATPPAPKPSEAMGLDPAAGSLSAAAAVAVDSGAAQAMAPADPGVDQATGEVTPEARLQQVKQRLDFLGQMGRSQGWNNAMVDERNALAAEIKQLQAGQPSAPGDQINQLQAQADGADLTAQDWAQREYRPNSKALPEQAAKGGPADVQEANEQRRLRRMASAQQEAGAAREQAQALMDQANEAAQFASKERQSNDQKAQGAINEGAKTDGSEADQTQQGGAQSPQAGTAPAGPAVPGNRRAPSDAAGTAVSGEQGLTHGTAPTEDAGRQAGPASAPQAQAQDADPAQRLADAGAVWTRMPAAERQALAARLDGVKPVLARNLPRAQWENLNGDIQRKLADALVPQAQAEAKPSPAVERAQAGPETDATGALAQTAPVAAKPVRRLDHGELNIPGRTNGIDAELDRYKAAQAKERKETARERSVLFKKQKAEARAALAEVGEQMVQSFTKLDPKAAMKELQSMATWEPGRLLALVERWKGEQASKAGADIIPSPQQTEQKPAAKAPAKPPRGVAAKVAEAQAARADYFTPGNIVKSYGGHDRVIAYTPPDAEGRWSVTVRAVQKQGDAWVDVPDGRERTHRTEPTPRELKAGPVERAPASEEAPSFRRQESEHLAGADFDVANFLKIMGEGSPAARSAAQLRPDFSPAARAEAVSAVKGTADAIRKAWANGPEVVVAFDMQDPLVPESARRADLKQRSGGAQGAPEGFYYQGKVYLMAFKLKTPKDAARVLFHEALGHHGLRGLFGKELGKILNQVATMRKADVDAKIKEYGLRRVNNLDRRTAAEEVLAEMAQNTPEISFVRRAVAAIRTWLRTHVPRFKSLALTDDELIRNYILPARAWVERGGVEGKSAAVATFSRGAAPALRLATNFAQARDAAKEFQGKTLLNADTGLQARVSRNTLDKMLSRKAVEQSSNARDQSMAVANVDRLYESALFGWSKQDRDSNSNIKAVHRFFAPMEVDGRMLLTKLTVKETVDPNHGNPLYTVETVEFNEETPAAQWVDASAKADGQDLTSIRSAGALMSLAEGLEQRNAAKRDAAFSRAPAATSNLPDAIIGNTLGAASAHPDYAAAKGGDLEAAVRLAQDLVTPELVAKVKAVIGDTKPLVAPVASEESAGRNKIPRAAAEVLAQRLGLRAATGIVQANRARRTGMDGLDRIFAPVDFAGAVEQQPYLLVDDTLTQGGTFAALASHIREGGGRVAGVIALTGKQYSAKIQPSPETLASLRQKHGDLENEFRAATGYGFDALTESEARYLARYEPADRLRDRISEEGRRGGQREDQGNPGPDEVDDGPVFSRSRLADIKDSALSQLDTILSHPGKVSLWDKTVGTMRHLAERAPAFKPVYESAQQNIDDVSMLANDAADTAPTLLPRVESLGDLKKKPVSAADNKAVATPLFEGTLAWGRDVGGQPMRVEDLAKKYAGLSVHNKAAMLLKVNKIDAGVLAMWQGLPAQQYEKLIDSRFESKVLKAGVVWSDKELQTMFGANAAQISLYREARAAIDRSIDMTARADMLRVLGDEYRAMRDVVLEQPSLDAAAQLLLDTLEQDAKANPDARDRLGQLEQQVRRRLDMARDLQASGYAPLSRFGRFTLDVVDAKGERQYFGLYETQREANLAKLQMAQAFPGATITQGTMSAEAYKLFAGVTPETLEQFGEMLGLNATGDEAQDKAFQEYLRLTKNNHSALKRLIHRKGIAGFSEDVGRVVANFVYSNARAGAMGLNAGAMEKAINAIPKEQGELKDLAMGLRDYIRDPQEEGQAVRGMLFAQYLGGSIASAFVNTTQPFAVTLPWLSQYGGMAKAGGQLARALKDMGRSIADRGFKYEPDLAKALQAAEDDGVVSPQEIHQLMAQARGAGMLRAGDGSRLGNARAKASNLWEQGKVLWGQPFALAEQFNRRSTFIAAYRTAKAEGMADPAGFARRAVIETQFQYSKANKPQWARGAIGGTLFTFKTYSVSYLELMHRMWNQGGPEGKRAVGWAVAMLLLMGGAGGLPFMEDVEDLVDGAAQLMGYNVSAKQWRKQLLADVVGKEVADFMEQGVSGLPGAPVDVSGRLGMGNLIPGTGLFLSKQGRERDLLEIAGPAGDFVSRGFTAARKVLTGDVGGAALELSPTAVRNLAKGADMATTGMYRDQKGYKVLDTTLAEAAAKAIGFQPKSVAEVQEANSFMQRSKSFYIQQSSEIKAQWADALFRKDEAAVQRVRERLADWNRDNPEQPIVVKMPDIWKRVREMGKDRTQRIADTAPKALREQMREMAKEARA